jgi:hypothetical protein
MTKASNPAPFRFLDLPPELRVMIYNRLPSTTRHCTLVDLMSSTTPPLTRAALVVKYFPVSILSTCKLIRHEATPVLLPRLQRLRAEPMRLITDTLYFEPVMGTNFEDIKFRDKNTLHSSEFAAVMVEMFDDPTAMRTIAGLPCTMYTVASFGATVTQYVRQRTPSSTIVAITRDGDFGLRYFVKGFTLAADDLYLWNLVSGPVTFMLRRSERDSEEDPPTLGFPEGRWRNLFRWLTRNNRLLVYGSRTRTDYTEDVDGGEWGRVWEEDGMLLKCPRDR